MSKFFPTHLYFQARSFLPQFSDIPLIPPNLPESNFLCLMVGSSLEHGTWSWDRKENKEGSAATSWQVREEHAPSRIKKPKVVLRAGGTMSSID